MRIWVQKISYYSGRAFVRQEREMDAMFRGCIDIGIKQIYRPIFEMPKTRNRKESVRPLKPGSGLGEMLKSVVFALHWTWVGAFTVFLGIFLLSSRLPQTSALMGDFQASSGNEVSASSLVMSLVQDSWQSATSQNNFVPGSDAWQMSSLSNAGDMAFKYETVASYDIFTDSDFCDLFTLRLEKNGTIFYGPGPILGAGFSASQTLAIGATDEIKATLKLSDSVLNYEGRSCKFYLNFSAWQDELTASTEGGFTDTPSAEFILTGKTQATDNISPVQDAYVDENNPGNNYGANQELLARSEGSPVLLTYKNQRTFIRFDFHLPLGAVINSSNLKLYMKEAPAISRNLEAKKALSIWTEKGAGGITWNTKPASSTSPSDTIASGTTNNLWLSFNVAADAQAIVDGTENYGWEIKDQAEYSDPVAYEAKFYSKDSSLDGFRPVLEVSFTAPLASTNHLVINEVYYDVGSAMGNDPKDEWLELYNPTPNSINLKGFRLCDNTSCDIIGDYSIPSHGFAVVVGSESVFDTYWTLPANATKIVLSDNRLGNGLANDGDMLELRDNGAGLGLVVDGMSYGNNTAYLNLLNSGSNKSLARVIKGYDFDADLDWIINATPNPGTNPGSDNVETIRFTESGAQIAGGQILLPPLKNEIIQQGSGIQTTAPNFSADLNISDPFASANLPLFPDGAIETNTENLQRKPEEEVISLQDPNAPAQENFLKSDILPESPEEIPMESVIGEPDKNIREETENNPGAPAAIVPIKPQALNNQNIINPNPEIP